MRIWNRFRKNQSEEEKIKYKIKLYRGGDYRIDFEFKVENKVLYTALKTSMRKEFAIKDFDEAYDDVNAFLVDPRSYSTVSRFMKGFVKQVEENMKRKGKNFKLLTGKIISLSYEREGNDWVVRGIMVGEYAAD